MKVVGLLCRDILLSYIMCRVLIFVVENEKLVTFYHADTGYHADIY